MNVYQGLVFHEVAHGYAAWRLGDPTARMANRLTLNPLKHIDPIGSVVLPLLLILEKSPILFGWAKPVPFNPAYFRNPRTGIMIVGAAGPVSNFILAVVSAILGRLAAPFWPLGGAFLAYLCVTNMMLGLFNLIPIPPLDGSRVLIGLLPDRLRWPYMQLERFGFIIVIVLFYGCHLDRVLNAVASLILAFLFQGL